MIKWSSQSHYRIIFIDKVKLMEESFLKYLTKLFVQLIKFTIVI